MSTTWDEMATLLERLERLGDPAVREDARALVALLTRLHGEALAQLVTITRSAGHANLLDAWKDDPQVSGLLLMYGLHPDDLASRVRRALQESAPVAAFLGVGVTALHISPEEVRLALKAAPDVPAAALAELRERIEAAILAHAPEVAAVRIDGGPRRVSLPLFGGRS
jgi:hypothetical protein